MDPNSISLVGSFINQYGFPVVVAGALFWYIVVETRANRKVIEELKTTLKELEEAFKDQSKVTSAFIDLVKDVTRRE